MPSLATARQLTCASALALAAVALALAPAPSTSVGESPETAVVSQICYCIKDTWVDTLHPNDTHGSANNLRVGISSGCAADVFRAEAIVLMQFDLSSIPSGSEVLDASLNLYMLATYPEDPEHPLDYSSYFQWSYCNRDWPEDLTASQVPLRCGRETDIQIGFRSGWLRYGNIATHVQKWVSGECPNYGFSLRQYTMGGPPELCNMRIFGSREYYYSPYLEITYRPPSTTPSPTLTATATRTRTPTATRTRTALPPGARRLYLPIVLKHSQGVLSIALGQTNVESGLSLDPGGDTDTEVVTAGSPAMEARRTGNGRALPSPDGNAVADYYLQLRVDDGEIYAGLPTTRVRVEVVYLDTGGDAFELQYDALSGGGFGDGRFKSAGLFRKASTGLWKTAAFTLCDAYFANRDLGADLRISDAYDGPETIQRVTLTLLSPAPCP